MAIQVEREPLKNAVQLCSDLAKRDGRHAITLISVKGSLSVLYSGGLGRLVISVPSSGDDSFCVSVTPEILAANLNDRNDVVLLSFANKSMVIAGAIMARIPYADETAQVALAETSTPFFTLEQEAFTSALAAAEKLLVRDMTTALNSVALMAGEEVYIYGCQNGGGVRTKLHYINPNVKPKSGFAVPKWASALIRGVCITGDVSLRWSETTVTITVPGRELTIGQSATKYPDSVDMVFEQETEHRNTVPRESVMEFISRARAIGSGRISLDFGAGSLNLRARGGPGKESVDISARVSYTGVNKKFDLHPEMLALASLTPGENILFVFPKDSAAPGIFLESENRRLGIGTLEDES